MRSILRLVTAATERAVSLNEARRHMRVEDTDQDDLIATYIEAAEQSLAYVGRALKPASYALDIYYGFAPSRIDLPMPPLRSVTALKTPGTNGVLAAIDPSNYVVTTTSQGRGSITMATAFAWPASAYPGWVTASVEFTAGYDIVPSSLRAAILLIAGTLFENRSGASPVPMTKLPYGVEALVGPLRELTM